MSLFQIITIPTFAQQPEPVNENVTEEAQKLLEFL